MGEIRILHVDDEPDIRELVDMSLALNSEFQVRACSSGAEAIETATAWSPPLGMT
jgi:two-component system OmpR family response regulator